MTELDHLYAFILFDVFSTCSIKNIMDMGIQLSGSTQIMVFVRGRLPSIGGWYSLRLIVTGMSTSKPGYST